MSGLGTEAPSIVSGKRKEIPSTLLKFVSSDGMSLPSVLPVSIPTPV